ncbi:MAG TPA: hypothetical protein IAA98_04515 [Candidatus Avipropionibacterium avicola]|uniref:Uncharacterized protein n=1 Tax=Candidatus Avipropionibacterium avicola TaxID=2840701 RepID=A0A9D1GW36_9ACTN|nr:hypothetical protein [Candidatus Avipropionibacterium avicola]
MVGKDPLRRLTPAGRVAARALLLLIGAACALMIMVGTAMAPAPAWADDPTTPPPSAGSPEPTDVEDLELDEDQAGAARTGTWIALGGAAALAILAGVIVVLAGPGSRPSTSSSEDSAASSEPAEGTSASGTSPEPVEGSLDSLLSGDPAEEESPPSEPATSPEPATTSPEPVEGPSSTPTSPEPVEGSTALEGHEPDEPVVAIPLDSDPHAEESPFARPRIEPLLGTRLFRDEPEEPDVVEAAVTATPSSGATPAAPPTPNRADDLDADDFAPVAPQPSASQQPSHGPRDDHSAQETAVRPGAAVPSVDAPMRAAPPRFVPGAPFVAKEYEPPPRPARALLPEGADLDDFDLEHPDQPEEPEDDWYRNHGGRRAAPSYEDPYRHLFRPSRALSLPEDAVIDEAPVEGSPEDILPGDTAGVDDGPNGPDHPDDDPPIRPRRAMTD